MEDRGQDYERIKNWDGRSSLVGIALPGYDLTRVNLEKARLIGANLAGSTLRLANLSGADLTNANLENCNLTYANLNDAVLIRARLTKVDLRNTSLIGVTANEANLDEATVWEADFQNACLNKASLSQALIYMCNMEQASLWRANLQQASMKEIAFIDANLTEINGRRCSLENVEFTGAYAWHADFLGAQGNLIEPLLKARVRDGCVLPDGSKIDAHYASGLVILSPGDNYRGKGSPQYVRVLAGEIWLTSSQGLDTTLEAGQLLDIKKQGANLMITALGSENAVFLFL